MKKVKVVLGKMVKKTAGKMHAWYESNVGVIRKPIKNPSK